MWLYVAGKHEVHFGVENFRTNTEAGPWRTGFASCPPRSRGSFFYNFTGTRNCVDVWKWERRVAIVNV